MKKNVFLLFLVLITVPIFSQSLKINYDVDTNLYKFSEPLNLWINFLKEKNDSIASKYWNKAEVKKYGKEDYFFVKNTFNFQVDYHKVIKKSDIIILSITEKNKLYKIKTSLAFPNKDDSKSSVMYIFNVYAKKENEDLKLFNPLGINEKLFMGFTTVGKVKFYYPKYHKFNDSLARKQATFLEEFGEKFKLTIDTVSWCFAETNEELQRLKGFDFLLGETSNNLPVGNADVLNQRAFGAGLGEYYPHELIHLVINPNFPNSHLWFNEGLCTYYGGSRGKDLEFHLKNMTRFLSAHPEINLDSMLNYSNMDDITGYRYAIGGYLMKKAYDKGGVSLQKELLKMGRSNKEFYEAIELKLGIKQDNLNEIIRKDLYETYF